MGVVELENGTVDVYLNHEYDTEENGQNAKVSKLSTLSYFSDNANKTVVLGFEDGAETESEVYMYVADTPKDLLFGKRGGYMYLVLVIIRHSIHGMMYIIMITEQQLMVRSSLYHGITKHRMRQT